MTMRLKGRRSSRVISSPFGSIATSLAIAHLIDCPNAESPDPHEEDSEEERAHMNSSTMRPTIAADAITAATIYRIVSTLLLRSVIASHSRMHFMTTSLQ